MELARIVGHEGPRVRDLAAFDVDDAEASARLDSSRAPFAGGNIESLGHVRDDRRVTDETRATGGCLCGAVRYVVRGPLRDVLTCRCSECRRWSGHVFAATAARREQLELVEERGLRWITSPHSESDARRGFCCECGSSLFWDAPARETVSIAAGSLDEPTGLRLIGHVYVSQKADYDELPSDGLPRYERLAGSAG
jgi:hypothetical protein